ncbi:MAG: hypothetical protein AAFV77_01365, partial [Planctomycetota bacterium]
MSKIQTVTLHLYESAITKQGETTEVLRFCDVSDLRGEVINAIRRRLGPEATQIGVIIDGNPVPIHSDWTIEHGGTIHAAPMPGVLPTAGVIALNLALAAAATAASYALTRNQLAAVNNTDDQESRRYGFNRLSFDARVGDPIPVIFGERRFGPKIISGGALIGDNGDNLGPE